MSWAWITSRGVAGEASITTARSCIAAYAFLAAERASLSPPGLSPSSAPLAFPKVSSRGALPVRPERHVATSIATLYQLLARSLLYGLPVPPPVVTRLGGVDAF